MRRKNWINKKNFFFGNFYKKNKLYYNYVFNKKTKIVDIHNVLTFTKNIFYLKNRYVNNNVKINSFYLCFLIRLFNVLKKTLMFRTFYKLYGKNKLILSPFFFSSSQFFEYRNNFFNILKINNVEGFYIYKNLFKLTGYYNDYLINSKIYINYNFFLYKNSYNIFFGINEVLKSKDSNRIGKVKHFSQPEIEQYNFNYYFAYNNYMNNTLELYKIITNLYINLLYKNN